MASNLSAIGFEFGSEDEFKCAMMRMAGETLERLAAADGTYAIWRSRSGAEIWFQMAPQNPVGESEIIGITPFYEGSSDVPVRVTSIVKRNEDTVLEGAFMAWVSPGEDAYPIVFDAVDFAAQAGRTFPSACRARITGFAHEVRAFASAEDYAAGQTERTPLAARFFAPVGMLAGAIDGKPPDTPPSSQAFLTGEVREHRVLTNEASGSSFHWMLVATAEVEFDIVADPSVVRGDIRVGGTVELGCLLLARFLD